MAATDTAAPGASERVSANTRPEVNERIRRLTEARLCYCAEHPEEIDRRLAELDGEWDIERVLEANAASFSLVGLMLGIVSGRQWLVLPTAVAAFLFQHAVQGWCPPLPVFRRLGIRTSREIEAERYALKCLRGDFSTAMGGDLSPRERARRALASVTGHG